MFTYAGDFMKALVFLMTLLPVSSWAACKEIPMTEQSLASTGPAIRFVIITNFILGVPYEIK